MATEGKRNPRKQIFFNGEWLPSVDPLGVGAKNYTDIQNWRYGQTGLLEGVAGYSKINASPHPTYTKGRSGIQLRTPFTVLSRTLLQALTFDESASAVIQNIANNAAEDVPNPKDFETAELYVDEAGAGLGRFSKWPNNQIGYCNGKTSQIYGGDEIPPAAFLTSSAPVTGAALTNPQDFSEQMRNDLQTADNLAKIGGGNDSYVVLLLHGDGADGSTTIIDSSSSGKVVTAVGNAQNDTSFSKWGPSSIIYDGTGDYVTTADHADFNFGTGAFTIDFWMRINAWPAAVVGSNNLGIFGQWVDNFNWIICNIYRIEATGRCYIDLSVDVAGVITTALGMELSSPLFVNEWHHIAIVRGWGGVANKFGVAVDGIGRSQSVTVTFPDLAAAFLVGQTSGAGVTYNMNGWIDEFRVSKGIARWTSDFSPPARAYSLTSLTFLAGFTRPVRAVKLYLPTGEVNSEPSSIIGQEHNGNAWTPITVSDGTKLGTIALAQTGSLSFTSTVPTSVAKLIEGRLLYWYQFTLSAGEAQIYQVTGDAPWQAVRDLWDGALRPVIQCRHYHGAAWIDNTMAVVEATDGIATATSGEVASVGALTNAEYIDVGLSERTCALKIIMYAKETGKINTNASVLSVEYWTGTAYAEANGVADLTAVSGKTLAQTGFVSWTPPALGAEMQKNQFGLTLWYYRIKVSATLSADVWIDQIQAIPAPQLNALAYKFPFVYQNRAMLCNLVSNNEGNRVDFAMSGSSEAWNGDDSSLGDGKAPLYFPGSEELTCAAEVYNRLGSSIYTFGIFLKAHATQLLHGSDADTYKIYPLSDTIGCPAPLTLDTCQVSASQEAQSSRSIAVWLSYAGPYMFDAGGLTPIPGLECYFDPGNSRRVTFEKLDRAVGWFDPDYPEYNLILPLVNFGSVVPALAIQTFDDATLSGTPVVIRFSAGGLYHYVVAYPTISALAGGTADDALTSPYTLGPGAVSGSMYTLETISGGVAYYFEGYQAALSSMLYDGSTNPVPAYTPSALSGTPRIAKTIINGVPYYFKMYPAKATSTLVDVFDSQLWVVYNMTLKRWFQKVPAGSLCAYPQAAFRVADAVNKQYVFGCRNEGSLMRLEHGTTWDGADIVQSATTGEFLPTDNIFDLVRIKRVKLACAALMEARSMAIEHYADGATLPTTLAPVALSGGNRHVRKTQPVNLDAWTHKFRFTTNTNATAKGVRLLVWGYEDEILRDDVH